MTNSSTAELLNTLGQEFDALLELDTPARAARLGALDAQDPDRAKALRRLLHYDQSFESLAPSEPGARWSGADSERPATIPGYRLLAQIGAGGMGRVYTAVAIDDTLQQVRAIKTVRRDLAGELLTQRFALECEALAALSHPGIAHFIEAGHGDDGSPYVVMEYVDGLPIDVYCKQGQLGLNARIELLRQLVNAVGYAHQRLIVHRDIKAANVLVSSEGKVVLVDFGVAKSLARLQQATMTAERFLTPRSAAPEQLAGGIVGTGCDIHGLGLLLYGLLCGHEPYPFDPLDPMAFQRLLLHVPAADMASRLTEADLPLAHERGMRSVTELQAALRGDIAQVVLRCLRKRPEERYASAGDLDRDLRSLLDGRPISERENESWYRLRKFVLRHRGMFALAGIAVLCLGVALGALLHEQRRTRHERDRAQSAVGLLQESFAAANPLGTQGGQTPISEVLDAALPLLEARREEQPALYADLAATLAQVELSAGRPAQALNLAQRIRDAIDPDTRPAAERRTLALLTARAKLEAGELGSLDDELAVLAASTPRELLELALLRGRLAYLQGDAGKAIERLEAALVSASTMQQAVDPLVLDVRLFLAHAYRLAGRVPEALALLDDTLALESRHFDSQHARRLLIRLRRFEYARHLPDAQPSLGDMQQLMEEIEGRFGPRSAVLARARGNLAQMHLDLKDNESAAVHLRLAWQGWLAATSAGHPNTLRALFNLAYTTSTLDARVDEADRLYRRLLDDARGGGELNSAVLSYWRISHLELLARHGRCERAATVLDEEFAASIAVTLNPSTRTLLEGALDGLLLRCDCAVDPGVPACHYTRRLLERIGAVAKPANLP